MYQFADKYQKMFQLDFMQLDNNSVEVYRLFVSSPANEIISVNIIDDDTGWLTYATTFSRWDKPFWGERGYFNIITALPVNAKHEPILHETQRLYWRHIQWLRSEMTKLDVLNIPDIEEVSRCGYVSFCEASIQQQVNQFTSQACDDTRQQHYQGWLFHLNLWELCINRLRNPLSLKLLQSFDNYFACSEGD
jgi:hypothetical protein